MSTHDLKLKPYYMLECDCSQHPLGDGNGPKAAARLRRLAVKHRRECRDTTMRLNRTVTYVWKGKGWGL